MICYQFFLEPFVLRELEPNGSGTKVRHGWPTERGLPPGRASKGVFGGALTQSSQPLTPLIEIHLGSRRLLSGVGRGRVYPGGEGLAGPALSP